MSVIQDQHWRLDCKTIVERKYFLYIKFSRICKATEIVKSIGFDKVKRIEECVFALFKLFMLSYACNLLKNVKLNIQSQVTSLFSEYNKNGQRLMTVYLISVYKSEVNTFKTYIQMNGTKNFQYTNIISNVKLLS